MISSYDKCLTCGSGIRMNTKYTHRGIYKGGAPYFPLFKVHRFYKYAPLNKKRIVKDISSMKGKVMYAYSDNTYICDNQSCPTRRKSNRMSSNKLDKFKEHDERYFLESY